MLRQHLENSKVILQYLQYKHKGLRNLSLITQTIYRVGDRHVNRFHNSYVCWVVVSQKTFGSLGSVSLQGCGGSSMCWNRENMVVQRGIGGSLGNVVA